MGSFFVLVSQIQISGDVIFPFVRCKQFFWPLGKFHVCCLPFHNFIPYKPLTQGARILQPKPNNSLTD